MHKLDLQLDAETAKIAGIERPDQQQMEHDFSQMAFQFILDRAPLLAPYGLGFEIVERDDDGSRVCGVFGYKIGKEFYMIPGFFINGQIKGLNSIYSKSTNSFQPLTEAYVNKLISRSTIELGDGVNRQSVQRDLELPNLGPFRSLGMGKNAGLQEMWKAASAGVCATLASDPEAQKSMASFLLKCAGEDVEVDAGHSDLIDFLSHTGPKAVTSLLTGYVSDAKLASAVLDFYGSLDPLMLKKFAADALEAPKAAAEKKVELVYAEANNSGCCQMSPSASLTDRKRLVRDGFIIKDRRTKEETSSLYDAEYPQRFNAPDRPGLYNLLLSSGVTTEAWILQPFSLDGRGFQACVETDKHFLLMAPSKSLFTRDAAITDGKSFYDVAKPMDDVTEGKRYLFVNEAGSFLGPVVIRTVAQAPNGRMQLSVSWPYFSSYKYNMDDGMHSSNNSITSRNTIEIIPDRNGTPYTTGSDIIALPAKSMKALELNYDEKNPYNYESTEESTFRPGSPLDVTNALYKAGFHRVTVASDPCLDSEVSIICDGVASQPMHHKRAFVTLVGNFGLSVDDAEGMLDEAQHQLRSNRFVHVKLAQTAGGVNMPWITPPEFSGSDPYSGMMTQTPFNAELTGTEPNALPPQDPFQAGMAERDPAVPMDAGAAGSAPDSEAMQLAMQAAQAGQKTVFDHAGIAGLAKLYDVGTVLDSYVPEMTKALDRLGRVLFLFQWKNDEFAERFGVDSLPEMEDLLVSVYKSYGDLLLKLREKAVNPDESASVNM